MKKRNNKGFTLVELMVVLVIIGILATLAIPRFLGSANKAKATECKPVLKEIFTLQTAYQMETGAYGSAATAVGFQNPAGTSRFAYDVIDGTNSIVGQADLQEALSPAAVGDEACITTAAAIVAENANIGGLLSAGIDANCAGL